jgi:soluble lytic murein transglycosylase-like protein
MQPRLRPVVVLTWLAVLALAPAPVFAQIYMWRDGTGTMVLSDRPKDAAVRTYAVSRSSSLRVTRPALSRRAAVYDAIIEQHSARQGVRPDLVRAVIQAESAFNPNARSVKGAMGLMQLMPATAAAYGVANAYDPQENVRAGVAYLRSLLRLYNEREELALAAYNAGPGAVAKYGGVVPPYRETIDYVKRIRGALSSPPAALPFHLYRTVQLTGGREIIKYSNVASPVPQVASR